MQFTSPTPLKLTNSASAARRLRLRRAKKFGALSYFSTLTSATVENAQPTKVVLTSSLANTKLVAGDFSITGKTISGLSRDASNKIITLTVTEAFVAGNTIVVKLSPRITQSVTNNIA